MSERSFLGYLRRNSKVGVRSHVVVIPSVVCVNSIAEGIAPDFSNVIALLHQRGCTQAREDREQFERTVAGLGRSPNITAVLVVGLGGETSNSLAYR